MLQLTTHLQRSLDSCHFYCVTRHDGQTIANRALKEHITSTVYTAAQVMRCMKENQGISQHTMQCSTPSVNLEY